jgi:hypothetical protein
MHDLKPNRRVPEGVDPQSWLGFEDRIGRRRFAALSVRIHEAVAAGDVAAARVALDEARELRPDAPELLDLETLVLATSGVVAQGFVQRAAGAVALLVLGVSMVVGIEWMRRGAEPGALGALGAPGASGAQGAPGGARPLEIIAAVRPTSLLVQSPARVPALSAVATPTSPAPDSVTSSLSTMPPSAAVTLPPVVSPRAAEPSQTLAAAPAAPSVAATAAPLTPPGRSVATAERPAPESEPRPITVARATADGDSLAPMGTPATSAERPPTPRQAPAPRETLMPAPTVPANAYGPANASIPPRTAAPPVTADAVDESRVADVLRQYARAYGDLNASAARDIWPSVDQRALARAFESLRSQQLSLQDCQIDVHGTTANASCRGQAQYVGKVGSGEPRIEPRTWRFELRREGEAWKIAHAEARRPTS